MPGDWFRSLVLILLSHPFIWAYTALNQKPPVASADLLSNIQNLYAKEDWDAVLRLLPPLSSYPAELDYYRGMALARLQRWQEASHSFEIGEKKAPADKRFLLELAGVSFKLQNFSKAKSYLFRALALDAQDSYAYDFLASLYFLEGNLEAALKYWNRVGKPKIEEIRIEPQPRLKPDLLDRAFAVAPASLLKLEDLQTTQARLSLLEVFPSFRFEILPKQDQRDQKYDLVFHSKERNGWGNNKIEGLLTTFRGLPAQTVYLEFYNLEQSALNFGSALRWDAQKRRIVTSFSGPLGANPSWRYRLHFDGRKENWDLSRTFQGREAPVGDLRLQKEMIGAEIRTVVNGNSEWRNGVEVAHREFRNTLSGVSEPNELFPQGVSLKYRLRFDHTLLRIPERRFTTQSSAIWEIARVFAPPQTSFSKVQGRLQSIWLPLPGSEDYSMTTQFRTGTTVGASPFDELFILGLGGDNDLWMRGHVATRHRKKGNGFLGRDYLLFNWEIDKIVYQHSLFDLRLGPFLDSGKIYDKASRFGSKDWLWDVGLQLKVRLLKDGPTVAFSYGKDLQTGRNAFYATYRTELRP
jgi:tetratricopeptide (TPR) repeat protein